jgi:hypothetical protein
MRLYEVAGNQFQDDLAEILRVLQGRANSQKTTSVIPWSAINNMMSTKGYADVNQDMVVKIKDNIDKDGQLIQNITPNGIVLKTKVSTPDEPTPVGGQSAPKSVDQMARSAAKDSLK